MKRQLKTFALIAIAGAMLLANGAEAKRGPMYAHSPFTKVSHKFMRGVGNLTLGWIEIPVGINEEVQNLDPLTGTAVGLGKGLYRGCKRTLVGAVELVTFPAPLPGIGYDPLLAPDIVMQDSVSRPEVNESFFQAPIWKRIGDKCKNMCNALRFNKSANDGTSVPINE